MRINKRKELGRFMRFAVVGMIGAVVDFGVFNLLTHLTPTRAVIASGISFLCALVSNFLWNRFWTYPDSRNKKVHHQAMQFILISLLGLVIRLPLFAWLEPIMLRQSERYVPQGFILTPVTIGHNLALVVVVLVVMIWNFLANRLWTYNDVS